MKSLSVVNGMWACMTLGKIYLAAVKYKKQDIEYRTKQRILSFTDE